MKQLLGFPFAKHDDGPDAGGMIKDELNRRWKGKRRSKPRGYHKEKKKQGLYEKKFRELQEPWRADKRRKRGLSVPKGLLQKGLNTTLSITLSKYMNEIKLNKSFTFTLEAKLALKVDKHCKDNRLTYSDFFRELVEEKLSE